MDIPLVVKIAFFCIPNLVYRIKPFKFNLVNATEVVLAANPVSVATFVELGNVFFLSVVNEESVTPYCSN